MQILSKGKETQNRNINAIRASSRASSSHSDLSCVSSFNFNPHKEMRISFDCSALWVRDRDALIQTFEIHPEYLRGGHPAAIDYRHWQIPLGRRFRSLKLWFVLRSFGLQGLRAELRSHAKAAATLAGLIKDDDRLDLIYPTHLGLVSFAMKAGDDATHALEQHINSAGYFVSHSSLKGRFFLRISIAHISEESDVFRLWNVIKCLL